MESKKCSVVGCERPFLAKTFCSMHYSRFRKYGDANITKIASDGEPQRWICAHKHYKGSECLDWPYAKVPLGYGYAHWNGKLSRVARIMCEINYGYPSEGMEAPHNCGNAHCVNPSHLRWDTASGNQADRVMHGTDNRGNKRKFAKLSDFDVLAIRSSRALPTKWLAKKYNISPDHVTRLQREGRWSWL